MKKLIILLLLCNVCRGTLVYDEMELKESITIKGDMTNAIGQVVDAQKLFFNDTTHRSTNTGSLFFFHTSPGGPARFALSMDTEANGVLKDVFKITAESFFFADREDTGFFTVMSFRGNTTNNRNLNVRMGDQTRELTFSGGAGANLEVEKLSTVNQYVTDDSTPTFAGLDINGNIDLNNNNLINVGYIAFEIDANAPPWEEGLVFYDDDEKTLSVYNNESDVTLQLGQEMFIRATNKSGSTILNGKLVYIDGAQGSRPTIDLAKADAVATCQVLAMATHDIADNATGFVTTSGLVHDVNTDSITAGDAIFLSAATAGAYTDTSPTAPDFVIQVGRCIFENSTSGLIYIDIGPTAVCGTMVIQDLDINTNLDVAGTVIGGDATFDSLTLDLTNDYLFSERGSGPSLAIQNLAPNVTSRVELFANIGDGTDALEFNMYAKGLPSDITNSEVFGMEYVTVPAGGPLFELHTSASGSGTVRPFRLYTGTNTTQLFLATDGDVGIGVIPAQKFEIGSADNSDRISIFHDNTNAFMRWSDGQLFFQTDEGTNTDTFLTIAGKGTGKGNVKIQDQDNAENMNFTISNGFGVISVGGSSPQLLQLQPDAAVDVALFGGATSGETLEFIISGFRTSDSLRSLEIGVGVDAADTASFDGLSNYLFDGSILVADSLIHAGDLDTFINFQDDQISLIAGNLTMLTAIERTIGTDEVVFNNDSNNVNVRIKAIGQANALFVRGSDGTVGIRTNSPDTTFQVVGTAGFGDDAGNEMLVSATGDTSWVGTAGLPFGDIHGFDENDTIAIGGIGIANKAQITTFDTDTAENNTDADHANDHIQITIAGFYFCSVSIHMESAGGGAADEFGFGVYKNNGTTLFENLHGHRKLAGGGGDVGAVTISGIIDLAVNDTIEVWCWNEDSTDDVVIDDITLSLIQVGGT